jgi:hypothetical protein
MTSPGVASINVGTAAEGPRDIKMRILEGQGKPTNAVHSHVKQATTKRLVTTQAAVEPRNNVNAIQIICSYDSAKRRAVG